MVVELRNRSRSDVVAKWLLVQNLRIFQSAKTIAFLRGRCVLIKLKIPKLNSVDEPDGSNAVYEVRLVLSSPGANTNYRTRNEKR